MLLSSLALATTLFMAQVAPSAPENLRCITNPAPALPGPGWQAVPVWEWRDVITVQPSDGTRGSGEGPYAVALDHSCNIYFTDSAHYQVIKMSKDGTVTARFNLPGDRQPGESSAPRGVAVDKNGNVYATDTPRDRVYKFAPDGKVLATWGVCDKPTEANKYCDTKQPGRFISPEGIAVDGADNIFVAEAAGHRLQKFTPDGQNKGVWDMSGLGQLLIPGSLSVDQGGFVYMSDGYNNQIVKFDPNSGAVVKKWGGEGSEFHGPLGVGVTADGSLYISDAQNWRVVKIGPDGGFQAHWRLCLDGDPPCNFADAGQEPGQFMASRGIAVDGQGTVYVADTNNQRLERLVIVDWELIPPPPPDDQEAE